jgi:hypothetical protein
MSSAPQLFSVLPAGELKRLLRQSLSPQTQIAWQQLGTIGVTQNKLGVVDAASIHPKYKSEIYTLDWPHAQVDVWVQRARDSGSQEDRIFAVLLLAPGRGPQPGAWQLEEGQSMAIDSATAAFGDYGRMLSEMRGGGTHAQTTLGRGSADNPQQKQVRQQAAAFLRQHGFPAEIETYATGSISVRFKPGLTEEQIDRANALLAPTGCPDQVWLPGSHTSGLLEEALMKSPVTQLMDARGPYLFACRTGFGDGIYYWDALQQNGQLVGYLCNFVPAHEEASAASSPAEQVYEADPILEAEPIDVSAPARDTSRATLAPPTLPGVIVSIKQADLVFWVARVERVIPGGFEVQKSRGELVSVPGERVIPNPGHHVFQVGDRVLAHWDQGHMFPGTITAITQQGYTVAWADGDTPRVVPFGMLTFWSWTQS